MSSCILASELAYFSGWRLAAVTLHGSVIDVFCAAVVLWSSYYRSLLASRHVHHIF